MAKGAHGPKSVPAKSAKPVKAKKPVASLPPTTPAAAAVAPIPASLVPPPKSIQLIDVEAGSWYRVHDFDPTTNKYAPDAFNDSGKGNARFSPLRDRAGAVIPTLYAADSPRGAVAEIVLRDIPTPSAGYIHDWTKDKNSKMHISQIGVGTLKLANLKSTGLKAAGLTHADVFAGMAANYPRTRELASYVWEHHPDAQGLIWMSVQANDTVAIMLFGDRVDPNDIQQAGLLERIETVENEVFTLLAELDCGVS